MSTNGNNGKLTVAMTRTPLVSPPSAKASVSSPALSGGISTSTIFPCTLAISSDDDVLAKLFWIMAIIIRPGTRNWLNGTSPTILSLPPKATIKMA